MSQFVTKLPVPLAETLALLPPGAHLDALAPRIDLDAQTAEIEIVWSHDQLAAPCRTGNEFPRELLKRKRLPEGVKVTGQPEQPVKAKTAATKAAGTDDSTPSETALDSQLPETPQ